MKNTLLGAAALALTAAALISWAPRPLDPIVVAGDVARVGGIRVVRFWSDGMVDVTYTGIDDGDLSDCHKIGQCGPLVVLPDRPRHRNDPIVVAGDVIPAGSGAFRVVRFWSDGMVDATYTDFATDDLSDCPLIGQCGPVVVLP